MIVAGDLRKLASARLADAKALLAADRLEGAAYLCGYVVELALKSRICRTLKWRDYPDTEKGYSSFKTHDLDVLLRLSGREQYVKVKLPAEWSAVSNWNPEARYHPLGSVLRPTIERMITAAQTLLRKL